MGGLGTHTHIHTSEEVEEEEEGMLRVCMRWEVREAQHSWASCCLKVPVLSSR